MKRAWPALLLLLPLLLLLRKPEVPLVPVPDPVAAAPDPAPEAPPAVPPLEPPPDPADDPSPAEAARQTESVRPTTMLWLLRCQNPDGSWGDEPSLLDGRHRVGKTATTALVLLSLLGRGYTHLSREELYSLRPGLAVKNALLWLTKQQAEDGSFPFDSDRAIEQSIASLALSEAYGMTATQFLKDPAARAIGALHGLEAAGGGWGDASTNFWGAQVYLSERLGEVFDGDGGGYSDAFKAASRRAFELRPDLDNALACCLTNRKDLPSETYDAIRRALLASPPSAASDGSELYRNALMMAQLFNHKDPASAGWRKALGETQATWRSPDGSYPGATPGASLLRTALAELTQATGYCVGCLDAGESGQTFK